MTTVERVQAVANRKTHRWGLIRELSGVMRCQRCKCYSDEREAEQPCAG